MMLTGEPDEEYDPMPAPRSAFAALFHAVRDTGVCLDPVNRERAAYLRGDIDVYEFEERVAVALTRPVRRDPTIPTRY